MEMNTYTTLPDLLTPDQAATYLNMSTEYVYKAIKRGTIKARKLGNKWRIQKAEIKRLTTLEEKESNG